MIRIHEEDINTIDFYDKVWESKKDKPEIFDKTRHRQLTKYVKENMSILDVGAGIFGTCELLAKESPELNLDLHCIDFSTFAKDYVDKMNLNITYIVGSSSDLKSKYDKKFDMVIAAELIEHLENPKELLDQMFGVCKLDGYIIISTLNNKCEKAQKFEYPEHLWEFSKESLIKLFLPYGEVEYELFGNYHMIFCKKIKNDIEDKNMKNFDGDSKDREEIFKNILKKIDNDPKNKTLLDIAAGHGRFSVISNELGYEVTAIDARDIRFPKNQNNIKWIKQDIESYDNFEFDIILMLGILYHLTLEDQLILFEKIRNSKRCKLLIIDTHICMNTPTEIKGKYEGRLFEEVKTPDIIKDIPTAAYNNTTAFWPTKDTLKEMLEDIEFHDIYETLPYHYNDRTFFIAKRI